MDQIFGMTAEWNLTTVRFLKIDVETALTFAGIALESNHNEEKLQRNRLNARKSYDTILRFLGRVRLCQADAEVMSHKLERLKLELERLGETF